MRKTKNKSITAFEGDILSRGQCFQGALQEPEIPHIEVKNNSKLADLYQLASLILDRASIRQTAPPE